MRSTPQLRIVYTVEPIFRTVGGTCSKRNYNCLAAESLPREAYKQPAITERAMKAGIIGA
jgi:hypothetical protein